MFMKTKVRGKWKTIDPAMLMKVHKLSDNRGEARMLLKGKAVITLSSAKLHKFLRIPQARRSDAPAKSQVVVCGGRGGAWLVSLAALGRSHRNGLI